MSREPEVNRPRPFWGMPSFTSPWTPLNSVLFVRHPAQLDHIAAIVIRASCFAKLSDNDVHSDPANHSCGGTPAAFGSPLLRLDPVLPHVRHRGRRHGWRGRTEPDQRAVDRRIGIKHFLRSGVDWPKPGGSAVLCIRNMFKGLLKTRRYVAVRLGVLSLIDVLQIEYP